LLFYIADRILLLGHPELQTMMYLKLSVAGHMTIFQTRTRGPWWSSRPAGILLAAVGGTQVAATLIAVYGAGLVIPLGWKYAGIVWGYALFWFLVGDPLKLLTYKVLDGLKADTKPVAIAAPAATSMDASQPADKPGSGPGSDTNAKPKAVANDVTASESPHPADSQSTTAAAPEPKSEAKSEAKSKPSPQAAKGAPEEGQASSGKPGTLMKTIVDDLARAGLLKDPERAGHIVADAIVAAQAPLQPSAPKAGTESVAPPDASPKAIAGAGDGERSEKPAPATPAKGSK
jgi:H+-transporting ATPase